MNSLPAETFYRTPIPALRTFCIEALQQTGMSLNHAETVADALVTADRMGVFTHGTKLLGGYLHRLHGGGYNATAEPRVVSSGPAWAIVDGGSALGQIGGAVAVSVAIEKAQQVGIAYVGLRNTGHIGAAGYYAWLAAQRGLIGLVFGNDIPSVTAPGSKGPVMGSNPFAYAVPITGRDPVVLDMATAAVAGGKVYAAHRRGEPIPSTWLVDRAGQPTTDGSLYPHAAALAPMAGHKGYGLALLAEILAGVLPLGAITWQVGSWMFDEPQKASQHNAAFIVIDIASMVAPTEFTARMRQLQDEIHAAPTAASVQQVMLPGEREWALFHDSAHCGIQLPADVAEKIHDVATKTQLPLPFQLDSNLTNRDP